MVGLRGRTQGFLPVDHFPGVSHRGRFGSRGMGPLQGWPRESTRPGAARTLFVLASALAAGIAPVRGAAAGTDWSDVGILSVVATGGNSESLSAGIKNTLGAKWKKASFELQTSGYRVKTTSRIRFALGPSATQCQGVGRKTDTKLESYRARFRYDHTITGRVYWVVGEQWERNELMGLKDRIIDSGGV